MTTPKDQYPKDTRHYPNAEPDVLARVREGAVTGPALQAELFRLAPSKVTVLLTGGSAALKRAVAQALHERSPRASSPFVVFEHCGLDSDQVELELFGGPAYAPRAEGAAQRAGTGTLYVAAIEALPLLVQPRFLRFLDQERKARVVASTEEHLAKHVERGHFRLDLAERLSLVELVLPIDLQSV